MKRQQANFRLTDHDRNAIAQIQIDFINYLPPEITSQRRILSASDVVRAAIRYLRANMNPETASQAYGHLCIELLHDNPSEPFDAPDRE